MIGKKVRLWGYGRSVAFYRDEFGLRRSNLQSCRPPQLTDVVGLDASVVASKDRMKSVIRACIAFSGWALVHSALATEGSKASAVALVGRERRYALYRLSYNALAIGSFALVWLYIHRLPDQPLYRIPYPLRALTQTARVGLLMVMVAAAIEVGVGPFSGISEVLDYLRERRVPREPEAQGPGAEHRRLKTSGPFRYVRHPLNSSAAAIALLTPEMTLVRLTVVLMTLAYSYLGSKLEEQRLLQVYGEAYRRYMTGGVPFFVPRFSAGE